MKVYTYSEARQNLASILEQAAEEGEVRVKRRDGQEFVIKPIRYFLYFKIDPPGQVFIIENRPTL